MKQRLLTFIAGLAGLIVFMAALIGVQILMHALRVGPLTGYAVLAVFALALYAGIIRLIERRKPAELALQRCAPEAAAGFITGIVLFSVAIATLVACRCYLVTGHGAITVIFAGLLAWVSGAIAEELIFRGFVFRVLQNACGTWIALVCSSLLFGAMHAFNPGATPWSSISIAVQAGLLLGLAYTLTQRLWLPIGIHVGWNFAEGTLYGTPVSGLHLSGSLLQSTLHGPQLLTGGRFGVEASIEATLACLAGSAVLYVLAVRAGRIVPLRMRAPQIVNAPV